MLLHSFSALALALFSSSFSPDSELLRTELLQAQFVQQFSHCCVRLSLSSPNCSSSSCCSSCLPYPPLGNARPAAHPPPAHCNSNRKKYARNTLLSYLKQLFLLSCCSSCLRHPPLGNARPAAHPLPAHCNSNRKKSAKKRLLSYLKQLFLLLLLLLLPPPPPSW